MSFERRVDGRYNYIPPEEIEIPESSVVRSGEDLLPLCSMCSKSRLTCENTYIREVEIYSSHGDPEEAIGMVPQEDGTYIKEGLEFKIVDGVKEGIYTKEEDIPEPFICEWFTPKDSR